MCKRWRHGIDFHVARWDGDSARYLQSYCMTCKRIKRRQREAKNLGRPVLPRHQWIAFNKKYPTYEEKVKARSRRVARRRKSDPEFARRYREYHRMYQALKREQNGVTKRKFKNRRLVLDEEKPLKLPVGPLAEFLRKQISLFDHKIPGGFPKNSTTLTPRADQLHPLTEIADICGLSKGAIHDLLYERQRTVDIDKAERILICLDGPQSWELWPELHQ